jgi:acyl dehydratase
VAGEVGLPGVVAHGMFTMALAARALDTWAGGPGRVRELGCKFTKPVVVPDDDIGVEVRVAGTVKNVTDEGVQVALTVTCGEDKVLGMPKAVLGV